MLSNNLSTYLILNGWSIGLFSFQDQKILFFFSCLWENVFSLLGREKSTKGYVKV